MVSNRYLPCKRLLTPLLWWCCICKHWRSLVVNPKTTLVYSLTFLNDSVGLLCLRRSTAYSCAGAEVKAVQAALFQALELPLGGVSPSDVHLLRIHHLQCGLINYGGRRKMSCQFRRREWASRQIDAEKVITAGSWCTGRWRNKGQWMWEGKAEE